MTNANARKGSSFEVALRDHARQRGAKVARVHDGGIADEGDLLFFGSITAQAKNTKEQKLSWLSEAQAQSQRAQTEKAVLIFKRRNHGTGKSYVIQDYDQWLDDQLAIYGGSE